MKRFQDVIGNTQIIKYLQDAIRKDQVSHAYLIHGEEGMGKRMLADIFSAALQCGGDKVAQPDGAVSADETWQAGWTAPCGKCHSCKQAESGSHPDIIWVRHEKPNSIGVEEIRSQLVGDIQVKPYAGKYKVYIVDQAEKLTVQAQNALLKTIEEPPEYGVILLLAANQGVFLPTILSRCVALDMKPIPDHAVYQYLMEECGAQEDKAEICTAFAQGNLGKAVKLADSESFDEMKDHVVRFMGRMSNMPFSDFYTILSELGKYKINIQEYLDLILVWFRDVLLFKVSKDANIVRFHDGLPSIMRQASAVSYAGIEEIIEALDRAKARLKANVNFDLVMELLFLTIKESLG
jgi:DNA polymerase-3 subunit delta'